MKLIDSIEFGKTLKEKTDAEYRLLRGKYDDFLLQPITIGMFVPCDDDGNVLEEPNYIEMLNLGLDKNDYNQLAVIFESAKSKVLFKGFEIKQNRLLKKTIATTDNIFHVFWKNNEYWELSKGIKTIEDLANYNLDLTVSF